MSVLGEPRFSAWVAAARTGGGFGGNITVVDKAPPEMLYLIDDHWYQYPPLNPLWHAILGLLIGILGFVSISGNGMVIYIFSSTKSLRTPSNLLVVNLAFSDFLMMTTMSPPMVINCYFETWILGTYTLMHHNRRFDFFKCCHLQDRLCANCTVCLDPYSDAYRYGR